jgi:hypothetical protein
VTTQKLTTIWKQRSTLLSTLKAESSSLTSNKNRSEFLSEQFWKVDLPAMPELVLQSYGMAQSIKRFIEEQGKGRQKVCLKS